MFDGLFLASTVAAAAAALASADLAPGARIAVIGDLRLARALAERGLTIVAVAPDGRGLRRLLRKGKLAALQAAPGALPFADRALAAVVGVGAVDEEAGAAMIADWARVVAAGGHVILVDRAAATEASRAALCAGLTEITQRPAGRGVVTSGVVVAL